jgi:acyl-CoA thioesterase-2
LTHPDEGPIRQILALERIGADRFRTANASLLASADARGGGESRPDDRRRVFGGQLLAQALRAATLTVQGDREVHSLHAYFVNGARADLPLELDVRRSRDGGRVSNRLVTVTQLGRDIITLQASFQVSGAGTDVADPPPPDIGHRALAPVATGEASHPWSGVRMLFATEEAVQGAPVRPIRRSVWMRVEEALEPDPHVRACALAYASDLTLLRTALLAEPAARDGTGASASGEFRLASLDHAMWFHRPADPGQWLLLSSTSPSTSSSRALTRGSLYDESGSLVATIAQEGVVRRIEG